MGTSVEINDTLQLTDDQGFPSHILDRNRHVKHPITLGDISDHVFEFFGKPGVRLFQLDPVRVFLVHNIGSKWLYWGHALIQSQQIHKVFEGDGSWNKKWVTSGTFIISRIYDPELQEVVTRSEAITGLSYF